jgi:hypothetical protein
MDPRSSGFFSGKSSVRYLMFVPPALIVRTVWALKGTNVHLVDTIHNYLGGLLASFALSGLSRSASIVACSVSSDAQPLLATGNEQLSSKAIELGVTLLAAFQTRSGLPRSHVNLQDL